MTTKKGPRATKAAELEIAVRLHGFTFTPEKLKADGSRKAEPSITLQASHEGKDPHALLDFLATARGELKIGLVPAEDSDLDGWQGQGVLGTVKVELPDGPADERVFATLRFPITVQTAQIQRLEDLIGVRLAMSRAEELDAVLSLEPVQPDLPLESSADGSP